MSHVAIVLNYEGKPHFAQAVTNPLAGFMTGAPKLPQAEIEGKPMKDPKIGGVHAAEIEASLATNFYSRVSVLRPSPPLTADAIAQMRGRFEELHGQPYEKDSCQLFNACTNCYSLAYHAQRYTRDQWFCSELAASMLRAGGRLKADNPNGPCRRALGVCWPCCYGRGCLAVAGGAISPEASEWMPYEIAWELRGEWYRLHGYAPTECTPCCCCAALPYCCKLSYFPHAPGWKEYCC